MSRHTIPFDEARRLPAGFRVEFDTETNKAHWVDAFTVSPGYPSIWIARAAAWAEAGRRGYVPEALSVHGEVRA